MYFLNIFPETLHVSADVSHQSSKDALQYHSRITSARVATKTTEDQELQKQGQDSFFK
jgi:hypothetical protein